MLKLTLKLSKWSIAQRTSAALGSWGMTLLLRTNPTPLSWLVPWPSSRLSDMSSASQGCTPSCSWSSFHLLHPCSQLPCSYCSWVGLFPPRCRDPSFLPCADTLCNAWSPTSWAQRSVSWKTILPGIEWGSQDWSRILKQGIFCALFLLLLLHAQLRPSGVRCRWLETPGVKCHLVSSLAELVKLFLPAPLSRENWLLCLLSYSFLPHWSSPTATLTRCYLLRKEKNCLTLFYTYVLI